MATMTMTMTVRRCNVTFAIHLAFGPTGISAKGNMAVVTE